MFTCGPGLFQSTTPGDPNFSSVVMLCHFDGTAGATTYVNSCPRGGTIASGSNTSLSTSTPLYGSACVSVIAGIVNMPVSTDYAIGTGDFTIEFATNTATPSQVKNIFDWNDQQVHTTTGFVLYWSSSQWHFFFNGADRIVGGTVATSTWQRLALCRVSGTTRMFVDGTQVGSNYTDANSYNANNDMQLGSDTSKNAPSTALYDELRITVGVGRYSSNYTVATGPFPNHG